MASVRDGYVEALKKGRYLEATSDEAYDRLISLTARTLKVPSAMVCMLDVTREWFQIRMNTATTKTHSDLAFCTYTILETVLVVPDALEDDRFKENPLVLGPPHIRFYAGAAMRVQGKKVGTLCVIDTKPRYDFGERELQTLIDIAAMTASLIEARRGNVLQLEQELARITMSVLCSIKQPLDALTQASRSMNEKWRDLQAGFHNQTLQTELEHEPHIVINHEEVRAVQDDATLLQDKSEIFQAYLDLSLKAASRLLDTDQSGSNLPRLVACDLEALIAKAKCMTSRCNPSCTVDWRLGAKDVEDSGSRFSSRSRSSSCMSCHSSPRSYLSLEAPPINSGFQGLYTHPDSILLILISLITLLSTNGREVVSVSIQKEEVSDGVLLTEGQISNLIAKSTTSPRAPGTTSPRVPMAAKIDEHTQFCEGYLKLYLVAKVPNGQEMIDIHSLTYLVDGVGGTFHLDHDEDEGGHEDLSSSHFTIFIPYLQS